MPQLIRAFGKFFALSPPGFGAKMDMVMTMRTLRRILAMSPAAWEVVIRALQLSCVMLYCAFMLLVEGGAFTYETRYLHYTARELLTMPQAVLLLAAIASAVIEERTER